MRLYASTRIRSLSTYQSEFVDQLLQSRDVGLVPSPLGLHGVHAATEHADLAIRVGHLLVELVDLFPVDGSVSLGVIESETATSILDDIMTT